MIGNCLLRFSLFFDISCCLSRRDEPDNRRTSVPERLDSTIYDTKYYSRDYRAKSKLVHISADEALKLKATKETSDRLAFLEGDKDLPSHPLVVEREKQGRIEEHSSKGMKIADVERYDKTGLRVFKTATWDAYKKALADDMPDHLPASWFMRHSGDGPVKGDDRAKKDLDTLIMEGRALPTNPFDTQRRRTKWHYTGRV